MYADCSQEIQFRWMGKSRQVVIKAIMQEEGFGDDGAERLARRKIEDLIQVDLIGTVIKLNLDSTD
jgi:hypothetical protein